MHVFYTPDIQKSNELPDEEAQHCIRVLRLNIGDEITLTNGKGNFYKAEITAATNKRCLVAIKETVFQEPLWPCHLHIGMAPTKNMDRNEWFAEKATEIGFDELTFLNCRFSERKVIKTERIEKILISAIKQSLKARLPKLNEMTDFDKFITREFKGQKFIAHCYEGDKPLLKNILKPGEDALVLIGPEGDFSEEEVKKAIEQVRIVSLDKEGASSTVHWRIGEASGRQVVLEFENGKPCFYENQVGVLTNSPDFKWQVTNLNNYVNLFPGNAPVQKIGNVTIFPFGAGSGFLGIPGDITPPSRFVRIAFYKATAPQQNTSDETILQCFHILNNFDIPIGVEFAPGKAPNIPSATQWTSAIDLTQKKVYYKTAYNNNIRCIDLKDINFNTISYQSHPLDQTLKQPIENLQFK